MTEHQDTGTTASDAHGRLTCVLPLADETACAQIALVAITDQDGGRARACPDHAIRALDGITGSAVDWADTKGLSEFQVKAGQ